MNEIEFVRLYARAWNTLSYDVIEPYLGDDVVYTSQQVFTDMQGKNEVSAYLTGKFETIRKVVHTGDVYAEVGYCGSQEGHSVQLISAEKGRPCVLMAQGDISKVLALVLLEVNEGIIKQIDVCSIVPDPATATRTGEYPE